MRMARVRDEGFYTNGLESGLWKFFDEVEIQPTKATMSKDRELVSGIFTISQASGKNGEISIKRC